MICLLLRQVLNLCCQEDHNAAYPAETKLEDYMWQKLWHTRVFPGETAAARQAPNAGTGPPRYDVAALSTEVRGFGEAYFCGRGKSPFVYFKVLLLCQQFERAVEFLWRRGMVVEAAHFALAMFHAGVLNVVDLQRPVTADDVAILEEGGAEGDDGMHGHGLGHGQGGLVGGHGEQQPQPAINLGLLLRDYTSQFWQSHPQCAVDYYATLWDFQVTLRAVLAD